MKPLTHFRISRDNPIRFLLSDIDDTMTDNGKLPAESYDRIWRLCSSGVHVIPVTGRPAGWCDLICRQWPVAGVIGENGAFAMYLDSQRLQIMYHPNAPDPAANRERLRTIADKVFEEIPGTRWAKDQFSRLFDVAIDFREEPPMLDLEAARRIKAIFEAEGAQSKISSIHVNSWYGEYDKISMAHEFLAARYGVDVVGDSVANRSAVFCGDSPNDEPMFAAFENSVGVANIQEFADSLTRLPAYVTQRRSAAGFVELADSILASRE